MHRIRSRYIQVALTYLRPWPMWIWIGFTAIFMIWTRCATRANYGAQFAILILGGSLAAWGGPIITAHVKEQMADPRSRLSPGFRAPHLIVAAVVFLAGVIGIALYTLARMHRIPTETGWPEISISRAGYVAVVLLGATLLAWMAQTQSPKFIFIVLVCNASIVLPQSQTLLRDVIAGKHQDLAAAIIGASTLGLVALWCRWAGMHEEMFEYWRMESFHAKLRASSTGDRFMRRAAAAETGWLAEQVRGAYRLNHLTNISAAAFWKRAARWRFVIANAHVNWLASPVLAAGLLAIYWGAEDGSRSSQLGLLIIIPAVLSLVLPITVAMITWPQRWYMIGIESLRPAASRTTFLREQGAAMAWEVANLWLWFTLGAFLPALIVRPRWFLSGHVGGALMITAAAQFWLFGVAVWILRLRMNWLANFLILLAALAGSGAVVATQLEHANGLTTARTPSPLWPLVMVVIGLGIVFDAYRRWQLTDID